MLKLKCSARRNKYSNTQRRSARRDALLAKNRPAVYLIHIDNSFYEREYTAALGPKGRFLALRGCSGASRRSLQRTVPLCIWKGRVKIHIRPVVYLSYQRLSYFFSYYLELSEIVRIFAHRKCAMMLRLGHSCVPAVASDQGRAQASLMTLVYPHHCSDGK